MSLEEHRKTFPDQYSHPLVGRLAQYRGRGPAMLVHRVVRSKEYGLMVHCALNSNGYMEVVFRRQDLRLIPR